MIYATDEWKQTHQGAKLGLMVVDNVMNAERSEALEASKRALENKLQNSFVNKEELANHFPISVYSMYYKQFKKTYHVLKQQESVIFKAKQIPNGAALVEAMFMAELKNGLLTAGHDYNALHFPLTLDAAKGDETYLLINGKEQCVKAQDMILSDDEGVISSIIYGPDLRTRILPETRKAAFVIYAPEGIPSDMITDHLLDIYSYLKMVSSDVRIEEQEIFC
ncbi:MAG: hypothetical protein H6Q73_3708 [Firmicutes bacterium]|nr:hypothetical protein [Bacillota bacterium]